MFNGELLCLYNVADVVPVQSRHCKHGILEYKQLVYSGYYFVLFLSLGSALANSVFPIHTLCMFRGQGIYTKMHVQLQRFLYFCYLGV